MCLTFMFFLTVTPCLPALVTPVQAQVRPDTTREKMNPFPYGSGAGLEILLTNSGFGLGGFYRYAISRATSLMLEVSLSAGKDEREVKFFSYFGRSYIPNKANYLLMMPVNLGVQRRLFMDTIEENFRPFIQITGGPTLGWEYPYFRDCNGDRKFDENVTCENGGRERTYDAITSIPRGGFRAGLGGIVAVGANFGSSRKMTQGVRVGYAFSYFFRKIEILEPDVPGGLQQFFGSPTISLTFSRLF